jgi:hypothetical protein
MLAQSKKIRQRILNAILDPNGKKSLAKIYSAAMKSGTNHLASKIVPDLEEKKICKFVKIMGEELILHVIDPADMKLVDSIIKSHVVAEFPCISNYMHYDFFQLTWLKNPGCAIKTGQFMDGTTGNYVVKSCVPQMLETAHREYRDKLASRSWNQADATEIKSNATEIKHIKKKRTPRA